MSEDCRDGKEARISGYLAKELKMQTVIQYPASLGKTRYFEFLEVPVCHYFSLSNVNVNADLPRIDGKILRQYRHLRGSRTTVQTLKKIEDLQTSTTVKVLGG